MRVKSGPVPKGKGRGSDSGHLRPPPQAVSVSKERAGSWHSAAGRGWVLSGGFLKGRWFSGSRMRERLNRKPASRQ